METVPIISIELSQMRHTIRTAVNERLLKMDTALQAALEKTITVENVSAILEREVRAGLELAIAEGVRSHFSYGGAGRKMVQDEIVTRLKNFKLVPEDE